MTKKQTILEREKRIAKQVEARRIAVFERFPLVFTLLGTFGLVATFYGFEHLIDNFEFLSRNPLVLLGTGIVTLTFTALSTKNYSD